MKVVAPYGLLLFVWLLLLLALCVPTATAERCSIKFKTCESCAGSTVKKRLGYRTKACYWVPLRDALQPPFGLCVNERRADLLCTSGSQQARNACMLQYLQKVTAADQCSRSFEQTLVQFVEDRIHKQELTKLYDAYRDVEILRDAIDSSLHSVVVPKLMETLVGMGDSSDQCTDSATQLMNFVAPLVSKGEQTNRVFQQLENRLSVQFVFSCIKSSKLSAESTRLFGKVEQRGTSFPLEPFQLAVESRDARLAHLVLIRTDLLERADEDTRSQLATAVEKALFIAAANGLDDFVTVLLEYGANPNVLIRAPGSKAMDEEYMDREFYFEPLQGLPVLTPQDLGQQCESLESTLESYQRDLVIIKDEEEEEDEEKDVKSSHDSDRESGRDEEDESTADSTGVTSESEDEEEEEEEEEEVELFPVRSVLGLAIEDTPSRLYPPSGSIVRLLCEHGAKLTPARFELFVTFLLSRYPAHPESTQDVIQELSQCGSSRETRTAFIDKLSAYPFNVLTKAAVVGATFLFHMTTSALPHVPSDLLLAAVTHRRVDIMKWLVDRKARVDLFVDNTPVYEAVRQGPEIMDLLVKLGYDLNKRDSTTGNTAFHEAVSALSTNVEPIQVLDHWYRTGASLKSIANSRSLTPMQLFHATIKGLPCVNQCLDQLRVYCLYHSSLTRSLYRQVTGLDVTVPAPVGSFVESLILHAIVRLLGPATDQESPLPRFTHESLSEVVIHILQQSASKSIPVDLKQVHRLNQLMARTFKKGDSAAVLFCGILLQFIYRFEDTSQYLQKASDAALITLNSFLGLVHDSVQDREPSGDTVYDLLGQWAVATALLDVKSTQPDSIRDLKGFIQSSIAPFPNTDLLLKRFTNLFKTLSSSASLIPQVVKTFLNQFGFLHKEMNRFIQKLHQFTGMDKALKALDSTPVLPVTATGISDLQRSMEKFVQILNERVFIQRALFSVETRSQVATQTLLGLFLDKAAMALTSNLATADKPAAIRILGAAVAVHSNLASTESDKVKALREKVLSRPDSQCIRNPSLVGYISSAAVLSYCETVTACGSNLIQEVGVAQLEKYLDRCDSKTGNLKSLLSSSLNFLSDDPSGQHMKVLGYFIQSTASTLKDRKADEELCESMQVSIRKIGAALSIAAASQSQVLLSDVITDDSDVNRLASLQMERFASMFRLKKDISAVSIMDRLQRTLLDENYWRKSHLIFSYYQQHKEDPLLSKVFRRWVRSLLGFSTETPNQLRYDSVSNQRLFMGIPGALKRYWMTNGLSTDDPQTLFLVGEYSGSCQSISDGSVNRALMSYVVNGYTRVITVNQDPVSKIFAARAAVRLLHIRNGRQTSPILVLEDPYPGRYAKAPEGYENIILSTALKMQADMGIPLLASAVSYQTALNALGLTSRCGRLGDAGIEFRRGLAPFVYSDLAALIGAESTEDILFEVPETSPNQSKYCLLPPVTAVCWQR